MPEAAQRQFLVRVNGIDGYFATRTGGNVDADVSKVWNGGDLKPGILSAPAEADDVTVSRPYVPERDAEILRKLRKLCGRWRTTVTESPTDGDLAPVASPTVYPDALLRGVHGPEADAGSGDAARLELVFAVSSVD